MLYFYPHKKFEVGEFHSVYLKKKKSKKKAIYINMDTKENSHLIEKSQKKSIWLIYSDRPHRYLRSIILLFAA